MTIDLNEWSGDPSNLGELFAPLRITVNNRDSAPLRLRNQRQITYQVVRLN